MEQEKHYRHELKYEISYGEYLAMREYEQTLFDTDEIISIDILMNQDEWEDMLKNALSEEYYKCDVVVNGTKFSNVAIRPKGNTSLSAIAMNSESDRYSFKLEFGHYVAGQTCFGLDKLILNNNYADATNMKEAIVYDMYQFIGADASLCNYASISLNGEYQGVYLALEAVEQSFILRNYGTKDGELYKPDSMEMGGGTERRGGRREENENSDNSNNSNDNTDSNSDDSKQDFGGLQAPPSSSDGSEQSDNGDQRPSFNGGPPSFGGGGEMPTQPGGFGSLKTLAGYGICLIIMIVALIFAKLFKRRR